jgi:AcrR family transcriptional regulator
MQEEQNTEQKILNAANEVFQEKGLYGARMQEIADKAGINKALLHYYYRTKEKLFETVFRAAVAFMAPKIRHIIYSDEHIFGKIRRFTDEYIDFLTENAFLPAFVINELNKNPKLIQEVFMKEVGDSFQKLRNDIQILVDKGEIKPVKVEHVLVNMISMSLFPIIAKPLLKTMFFKSEIEYQQFLNERKKLVADLIIESIKII